jgi:hypothetical protein
MNGGGFAAALVAGRVRLRRGFAWRVLLVIVFVTVTHQLGWEWLRFLTSEAVLRLSQSLGLAAARVSADTIRVQGELFGFVTSCTLVDVFAGTIPLAWNVRKPIAANLLVVVALGTGLFAFNILRLQCTQLLYAVGVPWLLADEVIGGVSYFAVWLFLVSWFSRNWTEVMISRTPNQPPREGASFTDYLTS